MGLCLEKLGKKNGVGCFEKEINISAKLNTVHKNMGKIIFASEKCLCHSHTCLTSCAEISPMELVIKICVKALTNFALCPQNGSLKCIDCSTNAWHLINNRPVIRNMQ